MEPFSNDHDNFIFKKRTSSNKQNIIANKNRSRMNKRKRQPSVAPMIQPFPITVDTTDLPHILVKYKICIYKSLNVAKLRLIAEGMGAQVFNELTKSITHLIIEPKGDVKQMKVVNQAVSKGIICASPRWLLACYAERKYCPPTAYQYDIDENTHTLDSSNDSNNSNTSTPVYNPFNTTYVDYDTLESQKPLEGGQLRMDGFIVTRPVVEKEEQVQQEPEQSFTDTPTEESESGAGGGEEEFFYNQEVEDQRLKSQQQRNLEMEKALEQRRSLLNERNKIKPETTQRKRRVVSNNYGERLKIWYGEQSFHQETIKRR